MSSKAAGTAFKTGATTAELLHRHEEGFMSDILTHMQRLCMYALYLPERRALKRREGRETESVAEIKSSEEV